MKLLSFHDLFLMKLREIYDMEKQGAKALPRLIKKAESEELQAALQEHADVTNQQIERLEQVFESLQTTAKVKKSETMKGLVEDAKVMMELDTEEGTKDAVIIATAQAVEHQEIACYGTAIAWAEMMEHKEAARLLRQTLDEEEDADKNLSRLAKKSVNVKALQEA